MKKISLLVAALVATIAIITFVAFVAMPGMKATPTEGALSKATPSASKSLPPEAPEGPPLEAVPKPAASPSTYHWVPERCGNASSDKVLLVFDDYPDNYKQGKALLDEAVRLNIGVVVMPVGDKAINNGFIKVGEWEKAGMMVGYHTHTHPRFKNLTQKEIEDEIVSDKVTVNVVRPPYGQGGFDEPYAQRVKNAFNKKGKLMCMWDLDPLDWKDKTPGQAADAIVAEAKQGERLTTVVHLNKLGADPSQLARIKNGLEAKGLSLCPRWKQSTTRTSFSEVPYCK